MEDKKKVKRFRPMTTDKLGKIKKLMTKGLNSREIADMIDIGESTAKRYMSILAAICDGQRIPVPPEQYNSSIVKEFCEMIGTPIEEIGDEATEPVEEQTKKVMLEIRFDGGLGLYDPSDVVFVPKELEDTANSLHPLINQAGIGKTLVFISKIQAIRAVEVMA